MEEEVHQHTELQSDMCLLIFLGDLIPRHMKVFKNNEFFAGLSIPEPEVRESIEAKMPRDFSNEGMDFLKVTFETLFNSIKKEGFHFCNSISTSEFNCSNLDCIMIVHNNIYFINYSCNLLL